MGDLDKLLGGAGEVLAKIPELYDDAVKPSAEETGKAIGRVPRLINAALAPLDKWILHREFSVDATKKLLAEKLSATPSDNIVSPDPYVAVPAIEAISYAMDSNDLRNMYANLLANSMMKSSKDDVHPAFVEVIKQLSPADAQAYKQLRMMNPWPVVAIRYIHEADDSKFAGLMPGYYVSKNITSLSSLSVKAAQASISNLERLKLIDVDVDNSYEDKSFYEQILHGENYQHELNRVKTAVPSGYKAVPVMGSMSFSDFSMSFSKTCLSSDE